MEENQEVEEKKANKILKEVDEKICQILEDGIQIDNLDALGKLIDIHKDIKNEKYWKKKEEVMEMDYRGYGNYGRRGVAGSGRGRYNEGSYSRRGVPGSGRGRYRGEDMMEEMYSAYQDYSEGRDNYGAEPETMKSLEYMLKSVVQFIGMLEEEASSPEEIEMIKHYSRKISEM